jgi:serine/threonine protein kinase
MDRIELYLATIAGKAALKRSRKFERRSRLVKTSPYDEVPEIAWDDIQIGRLLGRGSFNNVNKVILSFKDKCDDNRYAIKYLKDSVMTCTETFNEGAADLVTESKLLRHLQHENIVKLHGISEGCVSESYLNHRRFFLILDRLDCSLADKIQDWRLDEQRLSPSKSSRAISMPRLTRGLSKSLKLRLYERLRSVAIPVANALQYLHSKNILFRDLKPANIGLDANGTVKLFDFGLSREIKNRVRRMTGDVGSPLWMAPEVALSKRYGFPADIYSLAYVIWELGTLETPFEGITPEQHSKFIFVDNVRPKLDNRCGSSRLRQLISAGWNRSPRLRPGIVEILSVLKSETVRKLGPDQTPHNARVVTEQSLSSVPGQLEGERISFPTMIETRYHFEKCPKGSFYEYVNEPLCSSLSSALKPK